MGSKISIDKHVSNIEDILEMNPAHFSKLKFENNIPSCITQHIKIWRYYEDDRKSRTIKSAPLSLKDILSADFNFVTNECYLVLFVYKKRSDESSPLVNFPHSIWGVVESSSNLTPRGLETPVANSESISSLNKEALESFLLPKRVPKQEDSKFEYMLFVWNGKTANPLMKAVTLSAAIEFDALINKAKDPFLQVLFSGGYVRNKKLWMGKILQLDSSVTKDISQDFDKKFEPLKDTVYLLKFLFPGAEAKLFKPNGFKERFLRARGAGSRGDDEYVIVGGAAEDMEDEPAASEDQDFGSEGVHVEDSPMVSEERRREPEESDYSDEPPLQSARGHVEARPEIAKLGIPKFNIPIPAAQNQPNNNSGHAGGKPNMPGLGLGLANLASHRNGPPMESNRDSNKPKPKIQGFNLGNLDHLGTFGKPMAKLEINQNPQISDPARSSLSQERSNEDPPMSSGRTSESHDSRLRTERRGPPPQRGGVVPPLMNIEPRRRSTDSEGPHSQKNSEGELIWEGTESEIRVAKIEYYGKICSAVLDDFLFVSGQKIAYNETKLKELGITHIINMAGDACENMFPEEFNYLTYYAKDSKYENIECIFYETAAFIENVKQQNGRVLVHCVQGVSRSVTICMAYLILKHGFTFGQAYQHLRDIRGIASPNSAFWAQLYNFQMRISGASDKIPMPKVFAIGSFQIETPQTLVARLLYENSSLYNVKDPKYLDPRGVFILQSQDALYLWIGNEVHPANKDRYIEKAESYIEILQQYEQAPGEYSIVQCGEEPKEFWHLWKNEIQQRYGINKEWDYWYVDLSSHEDVVGTTLHKDEDEKPYQQVAVAYTRPALYSYPELEPNHRVEMDELIDENLLVLCVQEENHKVAYLWRGGFVPPEIEEREYLANVLEHRWPDTDPAQIKIKVEQPDDESDTFINYFE